MSQALGGALVAAVVAALAWRGSRQLFSAPLFARRNVRDVDVPVGVGVLAVLAVAAAEAVSSIVDAATDHRATHAVAHEARLLTLVAVLGFALLGLIDDLAGDHGDKGFRGHLRALAHGRLTTGGLKLVGGGLVALVVVAPLTDGLGELLLGGAVVALAANAANLFDRAPARATKVALVVAVVLVAAGSAADRAALAGTLAMVAAAVGLLVFELREELMLGDAGANPLGAALGLGVVATTGTAAQAVVLVVLVALNVAGERISFSSVIARTAPLRALDELGRRPVPDPSHRDGGAAG